MNAHRKLWNQGQQGLRRAPASNDREKAINLFMSQHARVHSAGMSNLSTGIDIEALRAYRRAVGRRTRQIVKELESAELKQKVDALRLQTVMQEGALVSEAIEIANYWGKRTIAGLLLMPPTRHNFLHVNEALRLRQEFQG